MGGTRVTAPFSPAGRVAQPTRELDSVKRAFKQQSTGVGTEALHLTDQVLCERASGSKGKLRARSLNSKIRVADAPPTAASGNTGSLAAWRQYFRCCCSAAEREYATLNTVRPTNTNTCAVIARSTDSCLRCAVKVCLFKLRHVTKQTSIVSLDFP